MEFLRIGTLTLWILVAGEWLLALENLFLFCEFFCLFFWFYLVPLFFFFFLFYFIESSSSICDQLQLFNLLEKVKSLIQGAAELEFIWEVISIYWESIQSAISVSYLLV